MRREPLRFPLRFRYATHLPARSIVQHGFGVSLVLGCSRAMHGRGLHLCANRMRDCFRLPCGMRGSCRSGGTGGLSGLFRPTMGLFSLLGLSQRTETLHTVYGMLNRCRLRIRLVRGHVRSEGTRPSGMRYRFRLLRPLSRDVCERVCHQSRFHIL